MDHRAKLKQVILYIASRMRGADSFGSTKLNKVLYRAYCAAFREGRTLTTFKFQKNANGPTLLAYKPLTDEMRQEGLLGWEERTVGRVSERRPIPQVEPDLRFLSAREMEILDQEIERAWSLTARQISDEEHRTAAWHATAPGEVILPELSFVEDPGTDIPQDEETYQWAYAAVERFRARQTP